VQWSLDIPRRNIIFYGYITTVFWTHDLGDKTGYWSYATCIQFKSCDGNAKPFHGYDDVPELELKPWIGDGSDRHIKVKPLADINQLGVLFLQKLKV
jgi:hypothetical protein